MEHPALLLLFIGLSIALIALFVFRPGLTGTSGGKIMAFLVLFALPLLCLGMGFSAEGAIKKHTVLPELSHHGTLRPKFTRR
jgi:hypothetical protein